jgi:glycosyltransferase involved in cell wall biosynthesis
VVVPNYNHARFLNARLDSIFAQSYRDFEIVFLDDASTDDSLRVFEPYRSNARIRTIFNRTNSGCVFKQWNKGVAAAHGEYIWFAESDDVAEPRFLETLVPLLDSHPNVGLAYANSQMIDVSGKILGSLDPSTRPMHPERWDFDYINDGRDECRWYLAQVNTIPNASAVLFRKDLYEKVGRANEQMMLMGDWEMWVRLLSISDIAYVAEPLNRFRWAHSASVRSRSRRHGVQLLEYLEIIRLILPMGLPQTVKAIVMDMCGRMWQEHLDHADGVTEPASHLRILERAQSVDISLMLAIVAVIAAHSVRSERANRRPLRHLLRQLLLPVGGRRHVMLKGFLQRLGLIGSGKAA